MTRHLASVCQGFDVIFLLVGIEGLLPLLDRFRSAIRHANVIASFTHGYTFRGPTDLQILRDIDEAKGIGICGHASPGKSALAV